MFASFFQLVSRTVTMETQLLAEDRVANYLSVTDSFTFDLCNSKPQLDLCVEIRLTDVYEARQFCT